MRKYIISLRDFDYKIFTSSDKKCKNLKNKNHIDYRFIIDRINNNNNNNNNNNKNGTRDGLGWVAQKLVNFNPGLCENLRLMIKNTVLIYYNY